jgi:hypothetical protein
MGPRLATLLIGVGATVLLFLAFKPAINGDGVGYYSYLHAVVVDHELNLADEYAAVHGKAAVWQYAVSTRTRTGLLADFFPVGPALLSLPAYGAALAAHPDGRPLFGPPFTTAFVLASLVYGLLALCLSHRLATRLTGSAGAALAGVVAVAVTTPFTYYLLYEPSYSHTFSAFTTCLFTLAWWAGRERRGVPGWLLLGLLGGLMALTRWQDGPLIAIAILDVPRARWRVLLMLPGVLLALAPQLWVDWVIFGTWLPVRPAGQELDPLHGHYLQVLVSSWHGLFVWHPSTLLALVGLALLRDRTFKAAAAYAFLLELAVNGAAPDWWGGFAFGARRFLDLTPFFAVGLAEVARRARPLAAWIATSGLAAWNALLIANLTYVIRTDHDPGYRGLVSGQLHAIRYLPNLAAQGEVVRDLAIFRLIHRPFMPGQGLLVAVAECACVATALGVGLALSSMGWQAGHRANLWGRTAAEADAGET